MTLTRQIGRNTIIQVLGKGLGVACGLVTIGIITRYLGQTGFGFYVTIFAFLQVFGIMVDFGLQMTAVAMISDPQESESEILRNILTLRFILSSIFLGLAPLIAMFFPYPAIVKLGIAVTALAFLSSSLISILTALFQKHLDMKKVAVADLAGKILLLAMVAASSALNLGLLAILISSAIASLLDLTLLWWFSRKHFEFHPAFNIKIYKKILSKTWPIALTIALNLIYFKADTIVLSIFRSPQEVGLYGAPYKVMEVLINLSYLFLGLLLPIMTSSYASGNLTLFKKILQKGFDAMIIVSIPIIFGFYFLGRPIMTFVAGPDFIISGDLLKILVLAMVAIFIASLFGYGVVAINKQKQMIKFYAINAGLSLVGYLTLIPIYSYWAAAWLTVFTEVFILATAFWTIYAATKFFPNLNVLSKSLAASLVMSAVIYLFAGLNLILVIGMAIIIYFVILYLIKGISRETIREIIGVK